MPEITDPTSLLIAARIRRYRTETLGWTVADAARALAMANGSSKLSAALLGRIENGTRAATVGELADICAALGCAFDWLTRAGELCNHCGQEVTR